MAYQYNPFTGNLDIVSTGGGGGASVSIGASAADILDATSNVIGADDAGADKIVFWDDSASKLTYLALSTGLTISGTTLTSEVTSAGVSIADVISVTSGVITADDAGADKIVFWDDSDSKLTYLTISTGLTVSGTTLTSEVTSAGISITDIISVSSGVISADSAGSDKLVFWDQSASKLTYLTAGTGLTITDTTLSSQVTSAALSIDDIISVTSGVISADDAGSDKIVFWDDSDSKLTYLTVGSGLSISGTTITATGGGGSGVDPVIAGMIF